MIAITVVGYEDAIATTVLIGCEDMAQTFALAAKSQGFVIWHGRHDGKDFRSEDEQDRAQRFVRSVMAVNN